jgi:hypothetical protein
MPGYGVACEAPVIPGSPGPFLRSGKAILENASD